ncbi:GHKL domain-containing protein [Enterococcus villorum]|uniref:GHKL domain-containing protein n=1 Tax=Enterococcus villorum TaxID=112904 RepID=UPI003F89A41D
MEAVVYILFIHLNFALVGFILFAKQHFVGDFLIRLCFLLLNLWFSEWAPLFLILFYFYNAFYLFYETKNLFIIVLLNTFCVNFIGIAVFLAIEIPRFLGEYNIIANTILQILFLLLILIGMRKLDQKYRITTYLYAYKKKRMYSTSFIFLFFIFLLWYHTLFPITSLDYILTSFILITSNSFYGFLMLMILLNEKKEEHYLIYMESMKKNEEYYQKLEEFRHDYKNYIGVLEDLLAKNQSNQELETVVGYEKEFFEKQLNDTLHMKLQKIYDPLLQGIFVKFIKRMEELGIPYKIQINHIIPKLSMNSYDMIRLFTNITENALIHYDKNVANDQKKILIKVESLWDCFYFEFSNPSKNTGYNLSELLKKGNSRQKESKGIGLYSVKKIVEENTNLALNLKYDKQEQRFYCMLSLKKERPS